MLSAILMRAQLGSSQGRCCLSIKISRLHYRGVPCLQCVVRDLENTSGTGWPAFWMHYSVSSQSQSILQHCTTNCNHSDYKVAVGHTAAKVSNALLEHCNALQRAQTAD